MGNAVVFGQSFERFGGGNLSIMEDEMAKSKVKRNGIMAMGKDLDQTIQQELERSRVVNVRWMSNSNAPWERIVRMVALPHVKSYNLKAFFVGEFEDQDKTASNVWDYHGQYIFGNIRDARAFVRNFGSFHRVTRPDFYTFFVDGSHGYQPPAVTIETLG